jgi:potassium channel subfamily K
MTKVTIVESVRQAANYAPLLAAILAPVSTLYDIPALAQKWYAFNGQNLPDPRASLILSGLSLAFSIIANVFLVLRFSIRATRVSESVQRGRIRK